MELKSSVKTMGDFNKRIELIYVQIRKLKEDFNHILKSFECSLSNEKQENVKKELRLTVNFV